MGFLNQQPVFHHLGLNGTSMRLMCCAGDCRYVRSEENSHTCNFSLLFFFFFFGNLPSSFFQKKTQVTVFQAKLYTQLPLYQSTHPPIPTVAWVASASWGGTVGDRPLSFSPALEAAAPPWRPKSCRRSCILWEWPSPMRTSSSRAVKGTFDLT